MSAPRPSLGFRPADALSLDDLTVLWREIYANYPVPLPYTEDELARFIARSGIGLGLSQIAIVDGAPVGLSLAARAADAAWIGGFGVIDSHRRTGVGLALARHQCRQLEDAGVAAMRLEVMAANPARCLYAAAGFVDRRLLFSFNSPAVGCGGADPLVLLQPEQLPALHRRLHVGAGGAPWQREIEGRGTDVGRGIAADRRRR